MKHRVIYIFMQSMVYALSSMACAAGNDFVFKLYGRRRRPLGTYLAVIGLIWTSVFLINRPFSILPPNAATIKWGIISGVFSIAANLLLVRAMNDGDGNANEFCRDGGLRHFSAERTADH